MQALLKLGNGRPGVGAFGSLWVEAKDNGCASSGHSCRHTCGKRTGTACKVSGRACMHGGRW